MQQREAADKDAKLAEATKGIAEMEARMVARMVEIR